MEKISVSLVMTIMVFLAMGVVSAQTSVCGDGGCSTIIAGKIYNADFSSVVSDATVEVTCGEVSADAVQSKADGSYFVKYNDTICNNESTLSVFAYKEGVGNNTVSGQVWQASEICNINLGVVNIPLVPEFGIIIGSLTIVGAVIVFFIIRRQ